MSRHIKVRHVQGCRNVPLSCRFVHTGRTQVLLSDPNLRPVGAARLSESGLRVCVEDHRRGGTRHQTTRLGFKRLTLLIPKHTSMHQRSMAKKTRDRWGGAGGTLKYLRPVHRIMDDSSLRFLRTEMDGCGGTRNKWETGETDERGREREKKKCDKDVEIKIKPRDINVGQRCSLTLTKER